MHVLGLFKKDNCFSTRTPSLRKYLEEFYLYLRQRIYEYIQWKCQDLLTNSTKPNPSWDTCRSATHEFPNILCHRRFRPVFKIASYPEPGESSPHHPTSLRSILILSSDLRLFLFAFNNKLLSFLRWALVSPTPNHQAGGPPLVGCPRLLIQYVRSYPTYTEAASSIPKLRTRPNTVTTAPLNLD
jgi:hypothetical protein